MKRSKLKLVEKIIKFSKYIKLSDKDSPKTSTNYPTLGLSLFVTAPLKTTFNTP